MKISDFDTDKKVLIIAEIGNNHEGNFSLACRMIDRAVWAGADAVKFQTIVPEKLVCASDEKRVEQLKRLQFSYQEYRKLCEHAASQKALFLSTPFDLESARFLDEIVPAFKIASSDNTFYPLLAAVAQTGKPIILSTGQVNDVEIELAIECINSAWEQIPGKRELALLHCVSRYPVPSDAVNLLRIRHLKEKYGYVVGYSDHALGIEASVNAAAVGARIIEKHFTIDKNYSDFRDHQLSADPQEFKELVNRIREVEVILGQQNKTMSLEEKEISPLIRRSIAAKEDLPVGYVLTEDDFIWVRPGTGIPAGNEEILIGKKLVNPVNKGILINTVDIGEGIDEQS